jgi:hypothetical protein
MKNDSKGSELSQSSKIENIGYEYVNSEMKFKKNTID